MRVVIQRVSHASVDVHEERIASINQGLLVLVGIEDVDSADDVAWLVKKVTQMRIFSDFEGKMNASLQDVNGEILLVSQFTLFASTKKGNRPSFIRAARPELAISLYESMIAALELAMPGRVAHGQFGADMAVSLCNDGPVTILMDSHQKE